MEVIVKMGDKEIEGITSIELENKNHMNNDILANKYNAVEYYMSRGVYVYFRNRGVRLRVDFTGTKMKSHIVYGKKYDIELSIFADSNEF